VEIAKRGLDAVRHGDYQGATRAFDADATWHNTGEFPGQRTCVGPQAIIDFWKTLLDSFEDGGMDIERVVEGEDSVVLDVRSAARGRTSGVPVEVRWSVAFRIRRGTINRVEVHGDRTKALKAVGLEG
jgi:ketosteroid isomerase-like protein